MDVDAGLSFTGTSPLLSLIELRLESDSNANTIPPSTVETTMSGLS